MPGSARGWLTRLSPNQQLGYGCLLIVLMGTFALYCGGIVSWVVRPALLQRALTPTALAVPTLAATPTQAPPTFINLPPGQLLATPTQAPIPTREPPTVTPTGIRPTPTHKLNTPTVAKP